MKKVLTLLMAAMMLLGCLAGCAADPAVSGTESGADAPASDKAYVQDKGTLVVGVTVFAPMDYQDKDGNWLGFDADMAKAFAEKLGVKAEFQIIDWNNKAFELEGKTIDVVWNGMTLTDEVKAAMSCSNAYCNNQQIVIVKKDVADQYQTVDSVKGLQFAVEEGSAGQEQVEALGAAFTEVADQATALTEVKAGTADAAVIDSLMAAATVGEGTSYEDLMYTVGLNDEEYGVGFRKGSDLVDELNTFFKESYADGTMMQIAENYGVQASIIEQK